MLVLIKQDGTTRAAMLYFYQKVWYDENSVIDQEHREVTMLTSRVTSKGQMTIPKPIREYLGIKEGDRLTFIIRDGEVIFYPVKGTLLDLRGSITPKEHPEDFDAIRDTVKEEIAGKAVRPDGEG